MAKTTHFAPGAPDPSTRRSPICHPEPVAAGFIRNISMPSLTTSQSDTWVTRVTRVAPVPAEMAA
tara:strand:+ start:1836 stop:2030 length:195 start_codon:yes stop_codon:yes gene_type:complete